MKIAPRRTSGAIVFALRGDWYCWSEMLEPVMKRWFDSFLVVNVNRNNPVPILEFGNYPKKKLLVALPNFKRREIDWATPTRWSGVSPKKPHSVAPVPQYFGKKHYLLIAQMLVGHERPNFPYCPFWERHFYGGFSHLIPCKELFRKQKCPEPIRT